MKLKKGMTMIELMVVLAVMAIVVAAIFSNVSKGVRVARSNELAELIVRQLGFYGRAWSNFYLDNGRYATTLNELGTVMKGIPAAPVPAKGEEATTFQYVLDTSTFDVGHTAAKDYVIMLTNISKEVCDKINGNFNSLSTSPGAAADPFRDQDVQCWRSNGDNIGSGYVAMKLMTVL